ncbi:hypothetical protein MEO43_31285 [Dolichospermum sp. ST_sed5]|nr:hypothetical protein [Dolichospermum sp. ST_sed5]
MVESGTYKKNQSKDGWMPCCFKCGEPFDDGDIGDAKNYPDDGVIAVFYTCEKCDVESEFIYVPIVVEEE